MSHITKALILGLCLSIMAADTKCIAGQQEDYASIAKLISWPVSDTPRGYDEDTDFIGEAAEFFRSFEDVKGNLDPKVLGAAIAVELEHKALRSELNQISKQAQLNAEYTQGLVDDALSGKFTRYETQELRNSRGQVIASQEVADFSDNLGAGVVGAIAGAMASGEAKRLAQVSAIAHTDFAKLKAINILAKAAAEIYPQSSIEQPVEVKISRFPDRSWHYSIANIAGRDLQNVTVVIDQMNFSYFTYGVLPSCRRFYFFPSLARGQTVHFNPGETENLFNEKHYAHNGGVSYNVPWPAKEDVREHLGKVIRLDVSLYSDQGRWSAQLPQQDSLKSSEQYLLDRLAHVIRHYSAEEESTSTLARKRANKRPPEPPKDGWRRGVDLLEVVPAKSSSEKLEWAMKHSAELSERICEVAPQDSGLFQVAQSIRADAFKAGHDHCKLQVQRFREAAGRDLVYRTDFGPIDPDKAPGPTCLKFTSFSPQAVRAVLFDQANPRIRQSIVGEVVCDKWSMYPRLWLHSEKPPNRMAFEPIASNSSKRNNKAPKKPAPQIPVNHYFVVREGALFMFHENGAKSPWIELERSNQKEADPTTNKAAGE